ncbi:cyclic nucleotide-gated ion channel 11 isoform X2 [Eutrema salsugineum]|uniref:cyclic nucleotide-gated ion channel 11 isoform X2 n=1 Tax=Eutrema salsugineum TaxID=72664 RepID=UPI000CED1434|nr:cyclic nucleotide-gated ion channel 11 isoform X2 [Eutrema salsugineum]
MRVISCWYRFDTRNLERSSTFLSVNGNFKNVTRRIKNVYGKIKTLECWRKTVLFVCVVALAIDPLFFFIPVVDSHRFCFTMDKRLGAAVCVLRTFIDTLYVIHIIFHCITVVIAPRSQTSLRGEIVVHSKAKRKRRNLSYFIIDILSILPIPQMVVLGLIPRKKQTTSLVTKETLKWVMSCQYIPRSIRIYPIFSELTRASGTVAETKWVGATLNLFLYMLPSHGIGAFWYLSAIEKKDSCWRQACSEKPGCNLKNLYCARGGTDNSRFLNTSCPLIDPDQITNSTVFNFGMYTDAMKSRVVESRDFPKKFFYCFWWGLRNISALGQNLVISNSVREIIFAIIICVSGLLLFAVLIGNIQKYLQSTTIRVDEMEEKKRDIEKWMSNRMLPEYLKERIRRYEDYKWRETRGTQEEALLRSLPKHLRMDIKRHLCLHLFKRVPLFEFMDDRVLDALCARSKTVSYTENTYIVRQGEPVEDMLFVTRGKLKSTTTYGGKNGFSNSFRLGAGDFCGETLFNWALDPNASHFPISSRTVQALTEVEGFLLSADDLKFVSTEYRLLHSKKLRHMVRFYSVQWRTWAACFIQAAWKRHCRRKLSRALREEEGKLHNALQNDDSGGNKLNLGAAIYASRFASHALGNLRANAAAARNSRFPHMLSLLPQKPADPDFPIEIRNEHC